MFGNGPSDPIRDAFLADLRTLSQRAHVYRQRPVILAGGGKSFTGMTAGLSGLKNPVKTNTPPCVSAKVLTALRALRPTIA